MGGLLRNTKVVALVVVIALAVAAGAALGSRRRGDSPATWQAAVSVDRRATSASIVSIDAVAGSPADFVGDVKVSGTVTSVDQAKHTLVLGCSDACVAVPITYRGQLPKPKSNVVVTGVITKSPRGAYDFAASNVDVR